MIDLHNHILPGVDDGSADLAESLEIARQFVSEGVEVVAATPHLDPLLGNGVESVAVHQLVGQVQDAVRTEGIPLQILPGNELFLTPEAPDLLGAGRVATLASTNYVLIEVGFEQRPLYLEDTIFRIQSAGFRPILAHPERYAFVRSHDEMVEHLLAADVPLQLTAPSILGDYGRAVRTRALCLLRDGAYTLLSSDRHHSGPARSLVDARRVVAEVVGEDTAHLLTVDNPHRVLQGRELLRPTPMSPGLTMGDRLRSWLGLSRN